MRYGMYVKTNMAALLGIYIAAEDNAIVEVSSGEAGEGDMLFSLDSTELYKVGQDGMEADGTGVGDASGESAEEAASHFTLLRQAAGELEEYFAGKRCTFTVPVRAKGTEFQRKVWEALRQIPYGETRSYGEIACQVGSPKGARAVGMACNKNPIMLLTPCHRVVGSDGKLVGFAGGIAMKEALLLMERANSLR